MSRLKIGLYPQGGERWIAGVIYLQNLIRACALLPKEEQPEFHLVYHPGSESSALRELGELLPPQHQFSHRNNFTKSYKLHAAVKCFRSGRWPMSLESLASQLKLSALFPVQASLGEKFPVSWVGWIPDFQHNRLPHFFSQEEYEGRDKRFAQLLKDCSHLVVSSQDAYNDLMRWFPMDTKRVSILRYCNMVLPEWLKEETQETVQSYRLPFKYLMFPSQFWIHKNHENLLRALAIVKKEGVSDVAIVFTGLQKDYRNPAHFNKIESLIKELGLQENAHCLGLLPRHNQIQLIRQAAAIVQPSYFEGWSSLIEDCRSLGKKIYLSDIPIHREQEPPDAVFFHPDNPEELAAHLKRDWPHLKAGPDLTKEAQAYIQSRELGVRYARDFLDIIARVER